MFLIFIFCILKCKFSLWIHLIISLTKVSSTGESIRCIPFLAIPSHESASNYILLKLNPLLYLQKSISHFFCFTHRQQGMHGESTSVAFHHWLMNRCGDIGIMVHFYHLSSQFDLGSLASFGNGCHDLMTHAILYYLFFKLAHCRCWIVLHVF